MSSVGKGLVGMFLFFLRVKSLWRVGKDKERRFARMGKEELKKSEVC